MTITNNTPAPQTTVDPAVIKAILGGKDPEGSNFETLIAAAAQSLGAAQWSTLDGSKDEGFVVNAASVANAKELTAVIDHAKEQQRFWAAQEAQAKDVIRAALTSAAQQTFGDAVDLPERITFKILGVPAATWNLAKDSRVLDTEVIKAKFPDIEKNAAYWRTQPGSRRLLIK